MNEPKFKVGDKVFTDNIIGEVTDVYYIGEKPRYRIKTPKVARLLMAFVSLTVQILKNDMQSRLRTKCRMKKYRKNYTRQ